MNEPLQPEPEKPVGFVELRSNLELLICSQGVAETIGIMEDICAVKADCAMEDWQDKEEATKWLKYLKVLKQCQVALRRVK